MATLNRIAIRLTPEQLSQFSDSRYSSFIDPINSLFRITLLPDGYAPGNRDLGERGVFPGFSAATVLKPNTLYSIEVSTLESRDAFGEILDALYRSTLPINNSGNVRLLEVWDYHKLDDAVARAQGYTVRFMDLGLPQVRSGSIRGADGQNLSPGGYTFTLSEV